MADHEPTVGEHLVLGLIRLLVRKRLITDDDLLSISDELDETDIDNAHIAAQAIRLEMLSDGPEIQSTPEELAAYERAHHFKRQMIARTRYIEVHGRAPPKTMEEAHANVRADIAARDAKSPDGGNDAT